MLRQPHWHLPSIPWKDDGLWGLGKPWRGPSLIHLHGTFPSLLWSTVCIPWVAVVGIQGTRALLYAVAS